MKPARKPVSKFGHSNAVLDFWRALVKPLLREQPTPFYLFSQQPIENALAELKAAFSHLPVRHWLSCKTQPLRPLLQWWQSQDLGIEVVSELELQMALRDQFAPHRILANGPAKHRWLTRHPIPGLWVNFDSINELKALLPMAKKLQWRVGLRINTEHEFDPETPQYPTQFGFSAPETAIALRILKREKMPVEVIHFHLRANIKSASIYESVLQEITALCQANGMGPKYIDCGGGFPPPHVLTRGHKTINAEFSLAAMARVYQRVLKQFPGVEEIWLENGRWLSGRSGVLVVKVLDTKERRGMRHLICDGGRAMNALMAAWENHELLSIPIRKGPETLTTVVGPTCMAFDQLARRPLAKSLKAGDHLLWLDAGAYHLSWETRFSHGASAVFWHDGKETRLIRPAERLKNRNEAEEKPQMAHS